MSQQSACIRSPQVHAAWGGRADTVMRLMQVLMNKDIKSLARLDNV